MRFDLVSNSQKSCVKVSYISGGGGLRNVLRFLRAQTLRFLLFRDVEIEILQNLEVEATIFFEIKKRTHGGECSITETENNNANMLRNRNLFAGWASSASARLSSSSSWVFRSSSAGTVTLAAAPLLANSAHHYLSWSRTAFAGSERSETVTRLIADRAILRNVRKQLERGDTVPEWLRAKVEEEDRAKAEMKHSRSSSGSGHKRGGKHNRRTTFLQVEDVENVNDASFGIQKQQLPPPSADQQRIIDFVRDTGRNVFITGGAGTGKSISLGHIIEALRPERATLRVAAPTGVAAMNVGGLTLHSLFGLFPGDEVDPEKLERKLRMKSSVAAAALFSSSSSSTGSMRRLIIDEISMVSPPLFEATRLFCQKLGPQRDLPWGGVQVIVCGDFLQLPPVDVTSGKFGARSNNKNNNNTGAGTVTSSGATDAATSSMTSSLLRDLAFQQREQNQAKRTLENNNISSYGDDDSKMKEKYCFQTTAWSEAMFERFDLRTSFRQREDQQQGAFLSFLNDARIGKVQKHFLFEKLAPAATSPSTPPAAAAAPSSASASRANKTAADVPFQQQQQQPLVVQIRATNHEVDVINKIQYDKVTEQNKQVEAQLRAQFSAAEKKQSKSNNNDNDSGILIDLDSLPAYQRPAFESTFVAHTTGKLSNGATSTNPASAASSSSSSLRETTVVERLSLQCGTRVVLLRNLDLGKGLVNGRLGTVVAFQRLPPGLRAGIAAYNLNDGNGDGDADGEDGNHGSGKKKKRKQQRGKHLPLAVSHPSRRLPIEHVAPDGVLPVVEFDQVGPVLMLPYVWSLTAGDEVVGTATQLPLRQAWAITSHRSQGLTLDRVEVDLRRFFDVGQGYVALSRARTAEGLTVLSAARAHQAIRACPIALEFQLKKEDVPTAERKAELLVAN